MSNESVKVKGIELELGDRKLVVPPLNFKALQSFKERLQGFEATAQSVSSVDMGLVIDVLHSALRRNYPDDSPSAVSRDFLEEWVDVGNMMDLMQATMDVGGLVRKEIEMKAASTDPSTGTSSTAS